MSSENGIDTREAFHECLREIVTAAAAAGVDVGGGWPVVTDDPGAPNWDVEIVRIVELADDDR